MFVRLFVDENLDRMVPISKQPKEKIQAIIDSCTRQFPEFAERARKRIRTYLKSCRRNKRARDPNSSWDAVSSVVSQYFLSCKETKLQTRPTPAHLTSVQAEQILATACENESHNAKRMRLGLEPVSQPMPLLPGAQVCKMFIFRIFVRDFLGSFTFRIAVLDYLSIKQCNILLTAHRHYGTH